MSKFYIPSDPGNRVHAALHGPWMDFTSMDRICTACCGITLACCAHRSFNTVMTHWQWYMVIVGRLCIKSHRATASLWCMLVSRALFGLAMSVPRSRERCWGHRTLTNSWVAMQNYCSVFYCGLPCISGVYSSAHGGGLVTKVAIFIPLKQLPTTPAVCCCSMCLIAMVCRTAWSWIIGPSFLPGSGGATLCFHPLTPTLWWSGGAGEPNPGALSPLY